MTTAAGATAAGAGSAATKGRFAGDPAERGGLDIAPSVLRKVAEYAADLVPGTVRVEHRVAGIEVGGTGASAKVSLGGPSREVDVRLELALAYPGRIPSVVGAVRASVERELDRITGYRVRTLAVTVTGLCGLPPPPRLL